MQRTILFLIADTGAGHRSAANAIRNAIELLTRQEAQIIGKTQKDDRLASTTPPSPYRIEIIDVFEEYSRFPLREAMKLYGPTIRHNPRLFGEVFHRSNSAGTVHAVQSLATPLILNGLLRLLTTLKPDVIVSIHPLVNFITRRALHELDLHIPFLTVVTDLVSIHYSWFAPGASAYIVPTEQAKQLYLSRRLDPERVHVLGMPIDPKFTLPLEAKESLQKKFELQPNLPVVLLVGGGDGAGGLQNAVRAISQARLPVQLLVVTGRNRRLYARLQRMHAKLQVPMHIFGFVHNMPEFMHAADVIVTKAGPGTICEALACSLPIILSGYIPGQEEGNVEYVLQNDVGVLARTAHELIEGLRLLIRPGSPELQRRLENAQRISRPYASFDIARTILHFLPEQGQRPRWPSPQEITRRRRMSTRMSRRLRSVVRTRRLPHRHVL